MRKATKKIRIFTESSSTCTLHSEFLKTVVRNLQFFFILSGLDYVEYGLFFCLLFPLVRVQNSYSLD